MRGRWNARQLRCAGVVPVTPITSYSAKMFAAARIQNLVSAPSKKFWNHSAAKNISDQMS